MFKAAVLKTSLIAMAAAMILSSSCEKAPEYQGEGPKMEFVRIPAGSFQMGSPATEEGRHDNEGPVHEVRITKPFYMGKYEVTQAQWKAVMGTTLRQQRDKAGSPWRLKGQGPEHPMYYVSWEEAVEFCKRLGKKFRLPTEAEWEYACRAGSQTRFYYGEDPNYSELDQYAWYYGKSNNKTHPVGQKKPNAWDLYDMHGNVYEWCSDRISLWSDYKNAERVNPTEPASTDTRESWRAGRGGCWVVNPERCRSASRAGRRKSDRLDLIGFRVVFAGRVMGDKEVLEIALPEKATMVASNSNLESESQGQAIVGMVRDESGTSIGDVDFRIIPFHGMGLREYANGFFEIYQWPLDPNTPTQEHHLIAQNKERNLAVGVQIKEDVNELEISLKRGMILTGRVVGSDGKGVKKATVVINELRTSKWSGNTSNWAGKYLNRVESDSEGRFEFRALPPGYDFGLSARRVHYRPSRTEVRSEDVRGNRIDGVSIVLPRGQFSVSGVVVDTNGKPVPDVRIWCSGKEQIGINARTDADGKFRADGIFKGEVNISAQLQIKDGKMIFANVNTVAGANDVTIVLDNKRVAPTPVKGRACFTSETEVWVDGAVVPISQVGRGWDVPGAPFGYVERFEEHEGAFECRDVLLDSGNRISVVDSHCFMLDCGRWTAAQDLRAGQRLKTITGAVGIKSVTIRPTPYTGKVYNLKISNSDRYAVGKDGVIVRDY